MKDSFNELTLDEMIVKRESLRRHLHDIRVKRTVGQINNPVELRTTRRKIARLNSRIYNFVTENKE